MNKLIIIVKENKTEINNLWKLNTKVCSFYWEQIDNEMSAQKNLSQCVKMCDNNL